MNKKQRKFLFDEVKNIAGQILTKTIPIMEYEKIGKNHLEKNELQKIENKAGRLPENSRNSFVDLQSQKNSKKRQTKKYSFN